MSGSIPDILRGNFAPPQRPGNNRIRALDWNIDRGEHFAGVLDDLRSASPDLALLQEVDLHTGRAGFRDVAADLAQPLKLNYVWGLEFQELLQARHGQQAYTGQATLSRWPIVNARVIRFARQSHFWHPHWFVPKVHPFQVRLGQRIALVAEIDFGGRRLVTYNLHLESRNTDQLRLAQLMEALKDSARYDSRTPIVLAGDLNLNANHSAVASAMERAGFRPVITKPRPTAHFHFLAYVAIDWVYVRGPVRASSPAVDHSVRASDHFPISFDLAID